MSGGEVVGKVSYNGVMKEGTCSLELVVGGVHGERVRVRGGGSPKPRPVDSSTTAHIDHIYKWFSGQIPRPAAVPMFLDYLNGLEREFSGKRDKNMVLMVPIGFS